MRTEHLFLSRDKIDKGVSRASRPHLLDDGQFVDSSELRHKFETRVQIPRKKLKQQLGVSQYYGVCDLTGFQRVLDGIQVRTRFVNGNVIPATPVGYLPNELALSRILQWSDTNLSGTQQSFTLWYQDIRLALQYFDAWLSGAIPTYLYGSGWINTTTHPNCDLTNVVQGKGAYAIDLWAQADYETLMDGWKWFRTVYSVHGGYTTADGNNQLGGLGVVNFSKYADNNQHLEVSDSNFCVLVSATLNKMLIALQRLQGSYVTTSLLNWGLLHVGSCLALGDLCQSGVDVPASIASTQVDWLFDQWVGVGGFVNWELRERVRQNGDGTGSSGALLVKHKFTVNLTGWVGTATMYCSFDKLDTVSGFPPNSPISNAIRTPSGYVDGKFHAIPISVVPGGIFTSPYFPLTETIPTFTLPADNTLRGWEYYRAVTVVKGNF